jgi:hypothetical protein
MERPTATRAPPALAPSAQRRAMLWELVFGALSIACVWPLLYTRYAPLQDLPQHLAAIRVLHDFDDPQLGFARFFELELGRTQYLAYYFAAHLLAYAMPVERANELLVMGSLVATPYALRSLLTALGKDGRMALLAFPLAYNAHLVLGFFNFVAAIPLWLWGMMMAVRQLRAPSAWRALGLAALTLVAFYTHVVPFGLLALGIGLLSLGRDARALPLRLAPLVPAAFAAVLWLGRSPAGQATMTAASGDGPRRVELTPPAIALEQLPRWLVDVLAGDGDRDVLYGWLAVVVLTFALALGERVRTWVTRASSPERAPDALARSVRWRLWLLPASCAALYFALPTGYDWIWPIAPRFPLLCALSLLVVLPEVRTGKPLLLAAAFVLSAASFHHVGNAFAKFEREEVADFDTALEHIPYGQRVVGLIFARGSRHVAFSPFIHFVAYYQARKGGAVMFSFADFPQSPFRFREDNRPPRVPPRWEWKPERVRPSELGFYDYALVRGAPSALARHGSGFVERYRGQRWSVFAREAE